MNYYTKSRRAVSLAATLAVALPLSFAAASPAWAFRLQNSSGGSQCVKDGSTCVVFCDNGFRAGAMNWNNNVWTDGNKSDTDQDAEAKKICAANGTACT